jgi:hypothetical protein
VIDCLTGKRRHNVEVLWHFHPAVSTSLASSSLYAYDASGTGLHIVWSASVPLQPQLYRGQENPPLGWVSSEGGRKEPGDVLALGAHLFLPAWIATLMIPSKQPTQHPRLHLFPHSDGLALTCEINATTTKAFLAAEGKKGGTFAGWSTDAAIAVVRETPEERSFLLADGRWLKQSGKERIRLPAVTTGVAITMGAEHLSIQGDVQYPLDIQYGPLRRVLVNGKEAKICTDGSHPTRVEA